MKREILVGVIGAATVVACLGGCSNNKSSTSSSNSGSPSAPKVTIDGQNQNISGQVSCTPVGANISIAVGDASNGVGAVVSNANPPVVHSVGLGNVNGVMLGYADAAAGQGKAQATKNGSTYQITGTATGVATGNSQQPVTKPFEMDVTCP
ncbi:MAG: lipoprotein LpqH [Mycobacteriaceae bacterium]|nr:lipoprotein LpqH [Mycobacteriaceae bacterium]